MKRYEITVTPVQLPARRITVDTINAVGVYLAGDVPARHLTYIERSLREDEGVDVFGFDTNVRIRIVEEQPAYAPIPRRDYGARADHAYLTLADELVADKVAA